MKSPSITFVEFMEDDTKVTVSLESDRDCHAFLTLLGPTSDGDFDVLASVRFHFPPTMEGVHGAEILEQGLRAWRAQVVGHLELEKREGENHE